MPILERPTPDEALQRVRDALGDKASELRLNFGQVDLSCRPSNLVDVMTTLRDAEGIRCRFFTFLSGVDRSEFGGEEKKDAPAPEKGTAPAPEKGTAPAPGGAGDEPGTLEVLIHVYSPDIGIHVNVHVPVDDADPVCPSITDVYGGAHWHERETFEMFGIAFDGHPSLVSLYLPEDFEGHPLRKSFKLPTRLVKDWPGAKDPEEAAAGGR